MRMCKLAFDYLAFRTASVMKLPRYKAATLRWQRDTRVLHVGYFSRFLHATRSLPHDRGFPCPAADFWRGSLTM